MSSIWPAIKRTHTFCVVVVVVLRIAHMIYFRMNGAVTLAPLRRSYSYSYIHIYLQYNNHACAVCWMRTRKEIIVLMTRSSFFSLANRQTKPFFCDCFVFTARVCVLRCVMIFLCIMMMKTDIESFLQFVAFCVSGTVLCFCLKAQQEFLWNFHSLIFCLSASAVVLEWSFSSVYRFSVRRITRHCQLRDPWIVRVMISMIVTSRIHEHWTLRLDKVS